MLHRLLSRRRPLLQELQRYDWKKLRALKHYTLGEESAESIPGGIAALAAARDKEEAERFYWQIDHHAVFNEVIAESALPTVRCVLAALHACTEVARPFLLEVLVEIGGGQPSEAELKHGNRGLAEACRRELCYGAALFFHLLENGTHHERYCCIDLLGLCAEADPHIRERTIWWFEKLLAESEAGTDASVPNNAEFLQNWLKELEKG
ncbi:hypothetical protein [Pelagibius marinus]|uniref:hypothetical protein n=1 Tax=Pelagibius marinus TaxID=2762760 RepID=UPI001872B2C6|nr:hypothetical protein [Pelagibius marinus]